MERELLPNETFKLNAYFTPSLKKKYKFKIPVEVSEVFPDFDLGIGYYLPGSAAIKK